MATAPGQTPASSLGQAMSQLSDDQLSRLAVLLHPRVVA